jgi:hypothetical protein
MAKDLNSRDSTYKDGSNVSPHRSTVATLLYIEAAIVLALGLWLTVFSFTHENVEIAPLLGEISFASLGALGLFAAGRGYARGKNYGRSPAILANLICRWRCLLPDPRCLLYRRCHYLGSCPTNSLLHIFHREERRLMRIRIT